MDERTLQHVIALADEGSFVRAAERVHLTPSAVSRSILNLENDLGVQLFDRTPGGVFVTPTGRTFVIKAREILADFRELRQATAQGKSEISGELQMGMVPTLAATYLSKLLSHCIDTLPNLTVKAQVGLFDNLLLQLQQERIEVIFVGAIQLQEDTPVQRTPIGHFREAAIFCRPEHPLAKQESVTAQQVIEYPFVSSGNDKLLNDFVQEHFALERLELKIRAVSDNMSVLIDAVSNSNALVFASKSLFCNSISESPLHELSIESNLSKPSPTEIVALSNRGRSLSVAAEYMIEKMRSFIAVN